MEESNKIIVLSVDDFVQIGCCADLEGTLLAKKRIDFNDEFANLYVSLVFVEVTDTTQNGSLQ